MSHVEDHKNLSSETSFIIPQRQWWVMAASPRAITLRKWSKTKVTTRAPFFLLLWKPEWICNMLVGIEGKIGGNARSSGAHRSPETAASRSGLGVLACAHQYTQSETTVHGSPPRLQLPPPRLSLLLHFRKVCYSGARSERFLSFVNFAFFSISFRQSDDKHWTPKVPRP